MKALLNYIEFTDFKGNKKARYEFNGKTSVVTGKNGSGKTTLYCGNNFAICGLDEDGNSNPNVIPFDVEEARPCVVVGYEIDGKPVSIKKSQKIKKSQPDDNGIRKISTTNLYEVNDVPMTERDFKSKMLGYGIDIDMYYLLTNLDGFLGQKKTEMHDMLFAMAENFSDREIALKEGLGAIVSLIDKGYELEEIKAQAKATYKKADEEAKNIPSIIIGMERSKVDVDVDAKMAERDGILKELSLLNDHKYAIDVRYKIDELEDEKFNLTYEINDLTRKENEGRHKEILQTQNVIFELKNEKASKERNLKELQFNMCDHSCKSDNDIIRMTETERAIDELKKTKFVWTSEFNEDEYVFDAKDEYCKLCGQKLPKKTIETRKKHLEEERVKAKENYEKMRKMNEDAFESEKSYKLNTLGQQMELLKEDKKKHCEEITSLKKAITVVKKEIEKLDKDIKKNEDSISTTKPIVAKEPSKAMKKLLDKKERLATEIERLREEAKKVVEVDEQIRVKDEALRAVEKELASAQNNAVIDKNIEDERSKQIEYEQAKANAEKVLYQLDCLSRAKNNALSESINKHFRLVRFELFEYLKNGNYKETVRVFCGDKEYGVSTNTALELLMKLDIIRGLQEFNNVSLPVFVDGAECLDTESYKSIEMPYQMIFLAVSDSDLAVRRE